MAWNGVVLLMATGATWRKPRITTSLAWVTNLTAVIEEAAAEKTVTALIGCPETLIDFPALAANDRKDGAQGTGKCRHSEQRAKND
jgi:hypothetical protein